MLASVMISNLLLLPRVNGGCSFSQEGKDTSGVFKDMDAARLAAKMAMAHQGFDIEAQKAESKRSHEAEPYVPQFYTADESEEAENEKKEAEEEVFVPEGAIWDLSSRSNKNSPKQEIGTAPNTSERHEEKIQVSTDTEEEEMIPVYRASSNEKLVDVMGEEKVWETMGETAAPGCPHAHTMEMEEEMVNEEAIDEVTVKEEKRVDEESDKPSGCPYSHKEL